MPIPTPRAMSATVATPAAASMLVMVPTSHVGSGARGLGCLPPHPLPDGLSLLLGIVNPAPKLPDLLL